MVTGILNDSTNIGTKKSKQLRAESLGKRPTIIIQTAVRTSTAEFADVLFAPNAESAHSVTPCL